MNEHQAIVETYMHALGMLADLPLGQAAIERELHAEINRLAQSTAAVANERKFRASVTAQEPAQSPISREPAL